MMLFAYLGLLLASDTAAAATDVPKFEDCPAKVEKISRAPLVRIAGAQARLYATRLREAAKQPVNFAGHFIFSTWGCGAGCVMGGVVDGKTGAAAMLPFTVSDWPLSVMEPLSFHEGSCLLVVQGSRDEHGHGTYYYRFDGAQFQLLRADEVAGQ